MTAVTIRSLIERLSDETWWDQDVPVMILSEDGHEFVPLDHADISRPQSGRFVFINVRRF